MLVLNDHKRGKEGHGAQWESSAVELGADSLWYFM